MTTETTLEALRLDFDQAFQRPREVVEHAREALLVIRAGQRELALVLQGVGELVRRPRITPVPRGAASTALLGLGAWHGELVAMFDVATLLGEARALPPEHAAWAAFGRGEGDIGGVGFVFDALLARVDVAPDELRGEAGARISRMLSRGSNGPAGPDEGVVRSVVTMAELVLQAHPAAAALSNKETS